MSPLRWLIDKSVLWRLQDARIGRSVIDRITAGTVGVPIVTELEIGYSARSIRDNERLRELFLDDLPTVLMPTAAENRAREVQAELVRRGQHRSVGVADLLIAATAELSRLTVLHYDADFDLIAEVTGQPMEWVVPRGSI